MGIWSINSEKNIKEWSEKRLLVGSLMKRINFDQGVFKSV